MFCSHVSALYCTFVCASVCCMYGASDHVLDNCVSRVECPYGYCTLLFSSYFRMFDVISFLESVGNFYPIDEKFAEVHH